MKPIKTIVAACLAAVALSVGALSLGACGPSAEEVVRQGVADELERLGLLNDHAYAETLVRHYSAKGYGPYRLREELRRRGVPREYWDEVLADLDDPSEAIDALLRQKLHGRITDRRELKRVSDALARRGYHWTDISAALRRYDASLEEDEA